MKVEKLIDENIIISYISTQIKDHDICHNVNNHFIRVCTVSHFMKNLEMCSIKVCKSRYVIYPYIIYNEYKLSIDIFL